MANDLIEFEWWRCVDGYRLTRSGLESASERFEQYRPLDTPTLFATFADAPHTAEGMLDFANQNGLLGGHRPDLTRRGKPKYESILMDVLLAHHAAMHRAVDLFENDASAYLIKKWNEAAQGPNLVRTELRAGPDGGVRMVRVPPDLIRAMWLQFAEHVCSGARLFRCERCNKPFTVGTGTGRRRTAMYCSNACKVGAYQARQRGETNAHHRPHPPTLTGIVGVALQPRHRSGHRQAARSDYHPKGQPAGRGKGTAALAAHTRHGRTCRS